MSDQTVDKLSQARDDIELLMCRVIEMRIHQSDYFARKQQTDKFLAMAKEKEVDDLIKRLRLRGYQPERFKNNTKQNKMF